MKIFLTGMIALLFLVPALNAQLPVWIEGAGVVDLGSPVNVSVTGSVLIDVMKNVQVRANVLAINLTNGFSLYLGSGLNLATLLHFPGKGKLSFYGVGGFGLFTGEDSTTFSLDAGLGAMMAKTKRMKLFLEGLLHFTSHTGGSDVSFSVGGGVRFR